MVKILNSKRIILLFVLAFLLHPFVYSDELEDNQKELNKIKNRISEIKTNINKLDKSEQTESGKMQSITKKIEYLSNVLSELKKKENLIHSNIKELNSQIERTEKIISSQKETTAATLRKIYIYSHYPELEMFFNSKNIVEVAKKIFYFKMISSRSREIIVSYVEKKKELEEQQASLKREKEDLEKTLLEKNEEQENLTKLKVEKDRLLKQIRQNKEKYRKDIAKMNADYNKLDNLVERLKNERTARQESEQSGSSQTIIQHERGDKNEVDFRKLKGKLSFPANGKISSYFGTHKNPATQTYLKNRGINIECEPRTPIKAAAPGEILYAGNMTGVGKIIMIDHGNNYYTVYAYLGELKVSIGDNVDMGQVIAFSLEGFKANIHFEIRQGKKALNPMNWLK